MSENTHPYAVEQLIGEPRTIVVLATPTVSSLEVSGPTEAFFMAADKLREAGRVNGRPYKVHLVSATEEPFVGAAGALQVRTSGTFRDIDGPIDTLLVIGGNGVWTGADVPGLSDWLRQQCAQARRYGSICTGAFVLAHAGLLDQQRVTTHWYYCERLAHDFPALTVDPEPIFIRNGRLSTSAGVTSGIDLALAMIEEDLGLEISLRIARALVMYVRRPGWQSQFSSALALQTPSRLRFRDLPFWILENLGEPLSIDNLAVRVAMGARHFSRQFLSEFGVTPMKFVAQLRVEMANRLIRESTRSKKEIAALSGFGSIESMDRALVRAAVASPRV